MVRAPTVTIPRGTDSSSLANYKDPPVHCRRGLTVESYPGAQGRLLPWRTPSAFAAPRAADTPPSSRSAPCAQGWAAGALPRRLPGRRDRLGLGRLRRVGTRCASPIGRIGRLVLREGRVPEPRTGGLHVHRAEVKAEPPASSRRGCAYRLRGAPGCGR